MRRFVQWKSSRGRAADSSSSTSKVPSPVVGSARDLPAGEALDDGACQAGPLFHAERTQVGADGSMRVQPARTVIPPAPPGRNHPQSPDAVFSKPSPLVPMTPSEARCRALRRGLIERDVEAPRPCEVDQPAVREGAGGPRSSVPAVVVVGREVCVAACSSCSSGVRASSADSELRLPATRERKDPEQGSDGRQP